MCHLSHRGQVVHLPSGLSVFFLFIVSLFFNHDFGVIDTPLGQGSLWDKDTPCQYQGGMLHRLFRSRYFFSARASLGSRRRDLEKLINRDLDIRLG